MRLLVNSLALGLPVAVASRLLHGPDWLTLVASALSLLPLAGWIGTATEHAASRMGAGLGGLLNATFGNAAELIIAISALRRGLVDLVKASLTGSIIGNTLLILGLSAFVGGLKHGTQKFDARPTGRHAAMMILAISGMALPAVFATIEHDAFVREEVSIGVSVLLLATYAAYVYFSYFSRQRDAHQEIEHPEGSGSPWSIRKSLVVLAGAVAGTAVASELLVHAIEPVSKSAGISELFLGLILIPIVGNVAEHYSAIVFASRNKMDLALSVAANSSTQIAVFVAPLLVLVSLLVRPMDLIFQPIELVTLFSSSAIFAYISLDGETNWLEGIQLLALYLIAAVAFFFLPK
ncbi:MAG TPA: calcium/proton exchanger [Thermoanaerobaculia bacterium]|nr:calcium/proton exchanger [Thermoanaerobaculia bacterium]